jgi:transposase
MMIIGVDYHPSFQQIAFLIEETGERGERQLNHSNGEAERFYRDLQERGIRVRVGMEATGYSRWFERLLAELGFELWIGDPAEIKTRRVKKQKTDRKDAQLLLRLMQEDNFPKIWVPSPGKSGSTTAAVAPASARSDAHTDHESVAGARHERR